MSVYISVELQKQIRHRFVDYCGYCHNIHRFKDLQDVNLSLVFFRYSVIYDFPVILSSLSHLQNRSSNQYSKHHILNQNPENP